MVETKINQLKKLHWLILWSSTIAIIIIIFLFYLHHRRIYPSTDDAYVNANIAHVAPQVSGRVSTVYVQNLQKVKAGQLLAELDPRPFNIAIQSAQADLALASQKEQALIAQVAAAQAAVNQRQADLIFAQSNAKRILSLVKLGQMSRQEGDRVINQLKVAQAALIQAQKNFQEAQANLGQANSKNANILAAQAKLAQAQLNLAYSRIEAPADGMIVNFNLRPGNQANVGQEIFALVEDGSWWVDANYKETQIERLHPGQEAAIRLDMYPDLTFHGKVYGISRGSGASFSLLPPENATGNWVKVTQRFPVRIIFSDSKEKEQLLRVGASATVTVDTRYR